jgi:hypothetical protein
MCVCVCFVCLCACVCVACTLPCIHLRFFSCFDLSYEWSYLDIKILNDDGTPQDTAVVAVVALGHMFAERAARDTATATTVPVASVYLVS